MMKVLKGFITENRKLYKLRRMVFLYFRLMGQDLKAAMQFQSDFLLLIFSSILTQALGFIFIWVIYTRIPDIHGWRFWEVAFIYAMVFFTEGASSFFTNGSWSMGQYVNQGELDRCLVRPVSPILQILASRVGFNGVGNMLMGAFIITQAFIYTDIQWTVGKVIFTIVLLISAIIIRICVSFMSNMIVFWTHAPNTAVPYMVHSVCEFVKYPISIYSYIIQAAVTIIIPYAFISFFPAAYIFDKGNLSYIGLVCPFAAVYCIIASRQLFNAGLKRYESTGN